MGASENLRQLRSQIEQFLTEQEIEEKLVRQITLVVDEACSNIIKHCYKKENIKPIDTDITLVRKGETALLTIEIYDYGERVDSQVIRPRELSDIRPGGLGTHLINTIMDRVEYGTHDDGNVLIMEKTLSLKGAVAMKPVEISVIYYPFVEKPDEKVAAVVVGGEVDMHSSPELRNYFSQILEKNIRAIVVDLSGVKYMDSSGIATLIEVLQKIKKKPIVLRLAGLTPAVKDIFELSKLESVFAIYPNLFSALKEYKLKGI